MKTKLLVLGLDGATFNCLNPLMDEGIIPNIGDLCNQGVSGTLRTIFPPVTAPAWLALATGLNPGKTGVFDYVNKINADTEEIIPISSTYYENRAIWNYLNEQNYKVGIFNYPTLSPPPRINGFAVSGIGKSQKEILCFPSSLEAELNNIADGYEVQLNLRRPKYKRNINAFFTDLNRIIEKQSLALKYLIQNKEWDFFFAVFSFTDWMQHVLWKDIDKGHPLYNTRTSPAVELQYKDTWKRIDGFIGELMNIVPNETNFLVVSDHGAGPIDSVFYANTWLEKKGWLKRKNLGWRNFLIEKTKLFSEGSDNKYYNAFLYMLRKKIMKIYDTMDLIDLESSLAYSPEHNTMFGCISLTKQGKKIKRFKEQLIQEIKNMPRNVDGIRHIQIYLPDQLYSGPHVDLSPDIFFIINNYQSTVEIDFSKKSFVPAPSLEMRTGGHQPEGIFIAKGNFFKNIRLKNISILDIAPTILALYNIEIPSQIDGQVITECIKPQVLKKMKIKIRKDKKISGDKNKVKEKGDLEEMKKVLKSLGYM